LISCKRPLEFLYMNTVNWVRFSWDLANFAPVCPPLPASFAIRRAVQEDQETVNSLVMSSFTLDSEWNPFFREIRPLIESALNDVFDEKREPFGLVVTHGARVIGASGLTAEPEAQNHLLTGPCIALEYHNRGLATALLAQSLLTLRDAGLANARGMTKLGSTGAQFIYPKFGSIRTLDSTKNGRK